MFFKKCNKRKTDTLRLVAKFTDAFNQKVHIPLKESHHYQFLIPNPKDHYGRFLVLVRLRQPEDDINNLTQKEEDYHTYSICKTKKEALEKMSEFLFIMNQALKDATTIKEGNYNS